MRARILRLAASIRKLEQSWSRQLPLALICWAALTALVAERSLAFVARPCAPESVDFARLEVTFSLSRFAASLPAGSAECRSHVAWSFWSWDMLFPLCYGPLLCGLYLWLERWRGRLPAGQARPDAMPDHLGQALLVLAPFAAALIDLFAENIPLGLVALALTRDGQESWLLFPVLVCIGSLAAVLKWLLLWVSVLAIVRELLAGPRGSVLARVRFSALAVLLGGVPLVGVDQAQDILQRIFEGANATWSFLVTLPLLGFAALGTWYCGRKLLELRLNGRARSAEDQLWFEYFGEQVPRVLGAALLGLGGLAFARAGLYVPAFASVALVSAVLCALSPLGHGWRGTLGAIGRRLPVALRDPDHGLDAEVGMTVIVVLLAAAGGLWSYTLDSVDRTLRLLRLGAFCCLALTACFTYGVRHRRQISRARRSASLPSGRAAGETALPERPPIEAIGPEQITAELRWSIVGGLGLSGLSFFLFTVFPVPVGRSLSAFGILCLFAVNMVFFGSLAVWAAARYRFPVVTLALGCVVLFSLWNDGHAVRLLEPGSAQQVAARPGLEEQFAAWRGRPADSEFDAPVFLVAAEGGGLRAAYWSATSLAALEHASPGFGRNVFALSGVSGGSLGAALFAALIADTPPGQEPRCLEPPHAGAWEPHFGAYGTCVRAFMREDYLSPLLAKFVAPDLVQAFLPFSVAPFDRSIAVEQSWEDSYAKITGRATFGQGLAQLATDRERQPHAPVLLLNSTQVESGRRFIGSALALQQSAGGGSLALDAADVLALSNRDVRLSTAVHNSARFPWVSPAARLDLGDGDEHGHLVDGGYFENSGLTTLREVFDAIPAPHQQVYVLYLCNDPSACARDDLPVGKPVAPAAASEWLSPVRGLLQTRNARASLARAALRAVVPEGHFLQLNVCPEAPAVDAARDPEVNELARARVVSPPLGWVLSELARDWMDRSLLGTLAGSDCYAQNAQVSDTVRKARQAAPQPANYP